MCVYHLYRCKTSIYCWGMRVPWCASSNKDRTKWTRYRCLASADVPAILIQYNIIVPPLGAYKSQLGGTYSLSLLLYRINVCYIYIYIYIYMFILIIFRSSCQFTVGVFARPVHSTSEFAMTVLSKCVIHAGFVKVA